jgi:ATP-dependent DNA helicase RecQ
VTASKSAGAIDEVLMGMLRDLRKKVSKNRYRHLLFSRSFIEDMALKYPISLDDYHGWRKEKRKKYGADLSI